MIEHPCCGCCGCGCFCGGGGHSHGRCYIPQVPHVSGGEDRRERGRVGHRPSGKREVCQRGAVAAGREGVTGAERRGWSGWGGGQVSRGSWDGRHTDGGDCDEVNDKNGSDLPEYEGRQRLDWRTLQSNKFK